MLVIGCGNPDRGDDAAGPLAARKLRALEVPAREHSGEALSLIELWRGQDEIVLVDAVYTGAPAGTVSVWDGRAAALESRWFHCSTHSLGVAEAIGIARNLGRLPKRLTVYGIEGRRFERGTKPSSAVLEAVEETAGQIARDFEFLRMSIR